MVEKPIIFSGAMVRAILDGRKSQTRRVLKKQDWPEGIVRQYPHQKSGVPYAVGDVLWVRENLTRRPMANFLTGEPTNAIVAAHAADDEDVVEEAGFNLAPWWKGKGGLPPIHMPRWASRISLKVTAVKVERLQDISEEDAIAEGVPYDYGEHIHGPGGYRDIWEKIHGPGSWEQNPWVVAISFERLPPQGDST